MPPRALSLFLLAAAAAAALPSAQPNLLVILVDDLRAQAGAFGQETLTPSIDALAARGVKFTRAYCPISLCSPSRTALLTGMRPDSSKLWTIGPFVRATAPGGRGDAIVTLPQALRARGARASGAGKVWHPGTSSGGEPSWGGGAVGGDDGGFSWDFNATSGVDPRLQFFECDAWMNSTGQSARSAGLPGAAGCVTSPACVACLVAQNGTDGHAITVTTCPDICYVDALVAQQVASVLAGYAAAPPAPFAFFAGLKRPHLGFQVPQHAMDQYAPAQRLAADRAPPAGYPPAGWWRNGEMDGLADVRAYVESNATFPGLLADTVHARLRRAYYASVTWMDSQLGAILDALDASGLAGSTWVVLAGDHGWSLGEHGEWAKQQLFENAARVPLIIAPPRGAAGWRVNATVGASDGFVSHVDIFPTIAELFALGGAVPAGQLDGTSLVPHLRASAGVGRAAPLPAAAFTQIVRADRNCSPPHAALTPLPTAADSDPPAPPALAPASPPCAMGMSIRTRGWRYTRWTGYNFADANSTAAWGPLWDDLRGEELYSHAADDAAGAEPDPGLDFDSPSERISLADDPAYASVKATLAAQLQAAFPQRSVPAVAA